MATPIKPQPPRAPRPPLISPLKRDRPLFDALEKQVQTYAPDLNLHNVVTYYKALETIQRSAVIALNYESVNAPYSLMFWEGNGIQSIGFRIRNNQIVLIDAANSRFNSLQSFLNQFSITGVLL